MDFAKWIETRSGGQIVALKRLGNGISGAVHVVEACGTKYLVKTLSKGRATNSEETMANEATVSLDLAGPNVDHALLVWWSPGKEFMLIFRPYFEGTPLTKIRELSPKQARDARKIFPKTLFRGYEAIVKKGLAHADLYPDNVIVDLSSGKAVITDFGMSVYLRTLSAEKKREVIIGDVIGLGFCLFSLYAGEMWNEEEDPAEVAKELARMPSFARELIKKMLLTPEVFVDSHGRVDFGEFYRVYPL